MMRLGDLCRGAIVGLLFLASVQADYAAASGYRFTDGYTTRTSSKDGRCLRNPADPVNIAFIGTHASWQNTMRAIGYEFDESDRPTRGLKWRQMRGAGGKQCILNGFVRTLQDGQLARGSGFRGGRNAKRHIRLFEQTEAYSLNKDSSQRFLLTVGDAHRDLKSVNCPGPGALAKVANDKVPREINGRSGYDDAAYLFRRAFPPTGTPYESHTQDTGHRGQRFSQCAGSKSTRYFVPWNGQRVHFTLGARIKCQYKPNYTSPSTTRDAWLPLGSCPTELGREGSFKL